MELRFICKDICWHIECSTFTASSFRGCSVQFSRSVVSGSLRPHESQHTRPPCPSPTPGVHPNSCSLVAQTVKHLPTMWETWVQSLGREGLLKKEMATHSRIIAWKIPLQRSLVGYSPWGCKESDTTERFHFFSHVHHSLAPGKQQGGNTAPTTHSHLKASYPANWLCPLSRM